MPGKQTLDRHAELMTHMASIVGVDLDEAELRGDLPPEVRDDMVLSCTSCADPGNCQKWLGQAETGDQPPSFCRNSDALQFLAAE